MRVPAALIALPLAAGAVVGLTAGEHAPALFALAAAAASALCLFAAIAALADEQPDSCTAAILTGALLAGVSIGTGGAERAYRPSLLAWFHALEPSGRSPAVLHGRLREDAVRSAAGVSLIVDVRRAGDRDASGGVRLSVVGTLAPTAMGEWRKGRLVSMPASLREPAVYRNPGVPDDRRALARRGIVLVGSVKSAALVQVHSRGSPVDEWASAARAWARSALQRSVAPWSERSAGVAAAIVIGDRSALGQEDERRLQEAGTYHVVAISGGNIAILTLLLLFLMRLARVPPRAAAAVAIVCLVFYARITGPSPSVDRAVGVAVLFLAGRLIDQRAVPLNVLAIAATAGIAASALAIADPGFILSFGATLAIIIGVPRARAWAAPMQAKHSRWPVREAIAGVLVATIAAEIALAPVAASFFGRVTFAGLLLNVAAIPLMTIIQAAAMATLAVDPISLDAARATGWIVDVAARALVDSARLVEIAPWLVRDVLAPALGVLATYYVAVAVALLRVPIARPARVVAIVLGLIMVVSPLAATRDGVPPAPAGSLRVVFLDVGQGDATLLVLPDGRAMLVDAGGLPPLPVQDPSEGPGFDIGDRVIARALRAFGVRSLDTLVLTHGDPDHAGGALRVMERFAPRSIWEGVPVPPHVPLQQLSAQSERQGMEWRTVQAGDRLRVAGVEIDVWHPPPPDWERQRVRNDDSIVVAIRYGRVSVVLPGDVGREGEAAMLPHITRTPLVVLKAPHHGSATSSTPPLIAATRPSLVVFSAGRDNRFAHPHPSVVARYRSAGAVAFSTAVDGAVILETDGDRVTIRGWWSGRHAQLPLSPVP